MIVEGKIDNNAGSFSKRMREHRRIFVEATRIPELHDGTLNVWVDEHVAIWPEFMIRGAELGNANEDFLFERCKIVVNANEYQAFRVRPYHRPDGRGGNGDKCLEIVTVTISEALPGTLVTIEFLRCSRP